MFPFWLWSLGAISLVFSQVPGDVFADTGRCGTPNRLGVQLSHTLVAGFPPGSKLVISGYVPKLTSNFSVELSMKNGTDIALLMTPMFNNKSISMKSRVNNKWNIKEEKSEKMPLSVGAQVKIFIRSLNDGFLIHLNDQPYTTFNHQLAPHLIDQLLIKNGLELDKVSYESEEFNLDLLHTTELHCESRVDRTPRTYPLKNGFKPGSSLTLSGFIPSFAKNFSLHFDLVPLSDYAIYLAVLLQENVLVRNSRVDGKWGKEERVLQPNLKHNKEFSITINCFRSRFEVIFNDREKFVFEHRFSPHNVAQLSVIGEIQIYESTITMLKNTRHIPEFTELHCDIWDDARPSAYALDRGFAPGSTLTITGFLPKAVKRFIVDLELEPITDIALHYNVQFDQKRIISNTYMNSLWGPEERSESLSLTTDSKFVLTINCLVDSYEISLNGKDMVKFNHRVSPHLAVQVRMEGGATIHGVTYSTPHVSSIQVHKKNAEQCLYDVFLFNE